MAQLLQNSTIGGKQIASEEFVNSKVKTDVPVNAKFTDTIYENATTSVSGLMSNSDKSKLDGVEAGANKYVHPAGTNPHGTTKSDVGLGNVDNVKQIPYSEKGASGGVAELDSTGKVLSSQLPSYVDDVLNYATQSNFPVTGESGKIYITEDTNKTYRWTGSAYVEISPSIALGETSATAYRGDRGKTAYDHSQTAHAPANAQKNSDITKAEIEAKLTGAITTHTHSQYIESSKFQVVESLPASPVSGTFYFVKE